MNVNPISTSRARRRLLLLLGTLLAMLSLVLLIAPLVAPQSAEVAIGAARIELDKAGDALTGNGETPTRDGHRKLPTVRLGPEGDLSSLASAPRREFIEMADYRMDGVPPVYAAHNIRGGDVILGWSVGDEVNVLALDGTLTTYQVVDERRIPKHSAVAELRGIRGRIVLQTCFYGVQVIRFLGLEPVD
jgi:hypothetical protein